MQCLEVSGAVRPIHGSLGVKLLSTVDVEHAVGSGSYLATVTSLSKHDQSAFYLLIEFVPFVCVQ